MRNHGLSGRAESMCYIEQAHDLNNFIEQTGIEDKVTLVGHSMGAKVAMAYSLLFPDRVEALCSIDSPPVDRRMFPEMNGPTRDLLTAANEIMPQLEGMTYKQAFKELRDMLKVRNKVLITALMMNLDKSSPEKAQLMINLPFLA